MHENIEIAIKGNKVKVTLKELTGPPHGTRTKLKVDCNSLRTYLIGEGIDVLNLEGPTLKNWEGNTVGTYTINPKKIKATTTNATKAKPTETSLKTETTTVMETTLAGETGTRKAKKASRKSNK